MNMNDSMTIEQKAKAWLTTPFDQATQDEVKQLMSVGGDTFADAFYKDLEFGTGGMRGIMGAGTNRVNKYTLGQATQGLANYLKEQFTNQTISVVIGHDCRNNSRPFATTVANVLSANGIQVYLFEDLRPTPEISYAIRKLNCQSGIILTASHNPKEYNGYKVYWNDGAQLVPPHDKNVNDHVQKVSFDSILFDGDQSLIQIIGAEMDEAFINDVVSHSFNNDGKEDLQIVFTSLHGTSIKAMPPALEKAGFKNVHIVEEQATPDGNFSTVKSPNPEEPEALAMALNKAEELNADIVIGTDPDADRIGVAVRNLEGEMTLLNGNQTAVLLTWYLLENWKKNNKLTGKEFVAETIVTTNLIQDIATTYDVNTYFCLTGFKWIAEIIRNKEGNETFIGGGEESFGYMIGDFVRDKDSITSGMICCEIAAWAKAQGKSMYELLLEIYMQYGYYQEHLISITKKGMQGAEEIQNMMKDLRANTPESLGGLKVVSTADYKSCVHKDLVTGEESIIDMPKSNVFQLFLEDGSKVTARPSGTEPKIKFYFSVKGTLNSKAEFGEANLQLKTKIDQLVEGLNL